MIGCDVGGGGLELTVGVAGFGSEPDDDDAGGGFPPELAEGFGFPPPGFFFPPEGFANAALGGMMGFLVGSSVAILG
jgi:hypothetical protein